MPKAPGITASVDFLCHTNPIFNDFSPALNIPAGKVSKLVSVKNLQSDGYEKAEDSPVGFPAVATCVFSARTPTVSGDQTFGA